jgi:hypothetical protein
MSGRTIAKASDSGAVLRQEVKRRTWTRDENDRLYAMFEAGVLYRDMAAEFGCSRDAIRAKLRAWNLRRHRPPQVTAAEIEFQMSKGLTRPEAAAKVGVTDKYARNLLWRLRQS